MHFKRSFSLETCIRIFLFFPDISPPAECLLQLRIEFGIPCDITDGEAAGEDRVPSDAIAGEFLLVHQGRVEGAAQQRHMHKIIAMACLQRGVLAVVGEAEQLVTGGLGLDCMLEQRCGEHRGRATPCFA